MGRRIIPGVGGAPARGGARVATTAQDTSRWTVTSTGQGSVGVATMAHAWEAAIAAHRPGAVVQVRRAAGPGPGRVDSAAARRGLATAPSR